MKNEKSALHILHGHGDSFFAPCPHRGCNRAFAGRRERAVRHDYTEHARMKHSARKRL